MTEPYRFPTDERFRRIAAAIADAVTLRSRALFVSASNKMWCRCPMGCFPASALRPQRRPRKLVDLGMTHLEYYLFTHSFDYGDTFSNAPEPFGQLGLAYRIRFP